VLDLRTLAIFVKVAERKSFVRAAAELGITQSGVSNAVKRLEAQLGTRLLARTTRRVSLTEDGGAFFERCRAALADLGEAENVLKTAQLKPSGNLHLDMPVAFGRLKILPLLGAFQARYPEVRLRVTFTDRYIDLIEESVDICVRLGALQDSTLVARRLTTTQYNVVAAPAYFAKHGRPKSPDDLPRHNCLAFTLRDTRLIRDWRFAAGDGETTFTPRGQMSFSDGTALCDAACAGYGLAQVHDYYLESAIARGKLVTVLDKLKPKADPAWLVYPHTHHLTPKVRAFVDHMVAQFETRRTGKRTG
jgi:LysR family transcriptional regulator, regulator for bpeEF and oprC